MIEDVGKYYLYRHIRVDTGQPFYIGIGTKRTLYPTYKHSYKRANDHNSRSSYWKNIVKKSDYEVEILLESNDYDFILRKEKEFIKLYGRKSNKSGILANLSNGGDGQRGYVMTEESKQKLSDSLKGRIFSKEWIEKLVKANAGKKRSEESKVRMSIAQKGKKKPPGYGEKMSKLRKGIPLKDSSNLKRGSDNFASKLTEENVIEIKKLLQTDILLKDIGALYGVKYNTISAIKANITWKQIII